VTDFDREDLVRFEPLFRLLEAGGEEEPDLLVGEAGSGPDPAEGLEAGGVVADLLSRFAGGAGLRRLAAVELAGGNLEQPAAGRVAVLADEEHGAVGEHRHDGGGAAVADHLHVRLPPVGEADVVDVDVEGVAAVDLAAAEELGPAFRLAVFRRFGQGCPSPSGVICVCL
jgi:hypothetical protein